MGVAGKPQSRVTRRPRRRQIARRPASAQAPASGPRRQRPANPGAASRGMPRLLPCCHGATSRTSSSAGTADTSALTSLARTTPVGLWWRTRRTSRTGPRLPAVPALRSRAGSTAGGSPCWSVPPGLWPSDRTTCATASALPRRCGLQLTVRPGRSTTRFRSGRFLKVSPQDPKGSSP